MDKIINSNLLLDRNWAQTFFIQNSQKIFGENLEIRILDIERSYTFNKEAYNILYSLENKGKAITIRASYSTQADKEINYKILEYLFCNGFQEGNILVPKTYAFFKNYNLLLYEDIPGKTFMYELDEDLANLVAKVILSAQALKKFHILKPPSFNLWKQDWQVNKPVMAKYYPELAGKIDDIYKYIFKELEKSKTENFCHGDFQPNNLIFQQNKLYLIDFGSVCVLDKEIDIASFIIQLKVMLQRFGNPANFKNLKEKFLSEYGDFNESKFNIYSVLLSLRILDFFIVFPEAENNRERIPFGYKTVKENLEKISIRIPDV